MEKREQVDGNEKFKRSLQSNPEADPPEENQTHFNCQNREVEINLDRKAN